MCVFDSSSSSLLIFRVPPFFFPLSLVLWLYCRHFLFYAHTHFPLEHTLLLHHFLSLSFFPLPCCSGVAMISRLLKILGLFCRISSLLQGSFAKQIYNLKAPTHRSHPISLARALRVCTHLQACPYSYAHAAVHTVYM